MALVIQSTAVAALPVTPAREWHERIRGALADGGRLVTMFGRDADRDALLLTAVVQDARGALTILRGTTTRETGVHALTRDVPAAHCFEREMHEQLGMPVADHPWLKPVRYEGANLGRMAEYPFYSLEGKEVHEVAVGPIHAGVIEPGAFRFMCLGETVHHLEIQLGYQHRNVEALLLRGDPTTLTPLVETIAGDTSIAHAWAHCAAIESLAGVHAAVEVAASRAVALELERIAMHLAGLAGLAQDIGFAQGASTYGRLRTTAINTTMRLCGNRFGRGWLRPGGAQAVMDADVAHVVGANLSLLQHDLAIINERFLKSSTVQHRFRGVGLVTTKEAREIGLVGPAARASGVPLDQRAAGTGMYGRFPIDVTTTPAGDCWSRAQIRIREIDRSLAWLQRLLEHFPTFTPMRSRPGELAPEHLVVSVCEGWRGEVVHCLETDANGRLLHYKVQDPSLRNWFGLALAVRNNEISDFPICNKSFDLSYCGNDL
jgi:Ni,Fe-hydrogenase III large subunit